MAQVGMKAESKTKGTIKLSRRQYFTMKKDSLAQRFEDFYSEHPDDSYIIQCALAVLVRNAFSPLDFSGIAKKLVRSSFLSGEDLASVRHLCFYFRNYFTDKEWATVTDRLFERNDEYLQLYEQAGLHIEKLMPLLHSKERAIEKKHNLKAAFEDETGKLHSWSLSNVVCHLEPQEAQAILAILGELTIFQKEGVRQFTRVVWLDYAVDEKHRSFDIRKEEDPLYSPKESEQNQSVPAPAAEEVEPVKTAQSDSHANEADPKKTEATEPSDSSSAKRLAQPENSQTNQTKNEPDEEPANKQKQAPSKRALNLSKLLQDNLPKTNKNGKSQNNKTKDRRKKKRDKNKNRNKKKWK